LIGVPWMTYVMVAGGLAIIYLFPRLTKAVPSPLVCIVVLTGIALYFGLDLRNVGDMGELPSTLPVFLLPDVPFNLETLRIVLPYSAAVAVVGLLESLMTAAIVDEMTDTPSNKNRECIGQGVANCAAGFLGGMAGCAMIGQTVINIKSGGRGRLSCFAAGAFLLFLIYALGDLVRVIPMAALVAIMIMVSIGTFSWASIRNLRDHPRRSSIVMIATVIAVVATHNLAIGVLTGVLLSGVFFASKVAQIFRVSSTLSADRKQRVYIVEGQIFFASADALLRSFDFKENLERVKIDIGRSHIWDLTGVGAVDSAVFKFRRKGTDVELVGLNQASSTIVDRLAIHDKPDAVQPAMGH